MYSDPNLDAPPPRSQFRRPWSPEAFELYPSGRDEYSTPQHDLYNMPEHHHHEEPRSHGTSPHRQHPRREASDVSVEALDLADYARTLRAREAEDPYPPFPSQFRHGHEQEPRRPPSSFPSSPLGQANAHSRDSLPTHPLPSLVSRGPTLSSHTTHHTSSSTSRGRHASRRPFSLPATPQASTSRVHFNAQAAPHRGPYIANADTRSSSQQEIDISHFPKWSRNWYGPNAPSARYNHPEANTDADADADVYASIPPSQLIGARPNTKPSPFDPGYVHDPHVPFQSDPYYSPYDPPPPLSSTGHGHGSRDVLPWSSDPPEYGPTLDPLQKEERMRMLEREFGANAKGGGGGGGKGKGRDDGKLLVDEEGNPLVGTIDERGRLVTVGPKRRIAFRTLQVLLAIGACVPALYAAVAIKPQDPKNPPPPAGRPPVIVLYVLSVVTLLLLLYMFVVRPCCCVRSKSSKKSLGLGAAANMGMMVLPMGGGGGKKNKKAKGGKKGMDKGQGQDVQVNLIVDPTMFQPPGGDASSSSESEDESDEGMMPGSYEHQQAEAKRKTRTKHKRRRRRRRGLMEGLAMEAEWKVARAWAKKLAVLDVAGIVLWGAAFVFILTGKKCPSGGFNGWCNAYNVSSASACLLAVAFGVSLFFDVQDLHASKQSPRTRTS